MPANCDRSITSLTSGISRNGITHRAVTNAYAGRSYGDPRCAADSLPRASHVCKYIDATVSSTGGKRLLHGIDCIAAILTQSGILDYRERLTPYAYRSLARAACKVFPDLKVNGAVAGSAVL